MVDPGRLAALLERIADEVLALRRLAERDAATLVTDELALPAAKYRLIVAVEAAIDAGEHITSSEGPRASTDYADTFAVLADAGWLETDLAARLADAPSLSPRAR